MSKYLDRMIVIAMAALLSVAAVSHVMATERDVSDTSAHSTPPVVIHTSSKTV
jgi:hypothetical protein